MLSKSFEDAVNLPVDLSGWFFCSGKSHRLYLVVVKHTFVDNVSGAGTRTLEMIVGFLRWVSP